LRSQRRAVHDAGSAELNDDQVAIVAEKKQGATDWKAYARAALRELSMKDMPSFEILFLDELAGWAFSASNPGHGYNDTHGALVVTALLGAVERADATDAFAKGLAERHGGRLAFEESKEAEYAPPADERLGYL
jgi:hypothetical protein